jgi:hypothetical protein
MQGFTRAGISPGRRKLSNRLIKKTKMKPRPPAVQCISKRELLQSEGHRLINGWINPIQGIDGSDTQCWPQVTRPGSSVGRPARKRGPSRDNAAVEGGGFDSGFGWDEPEQVVGRSSWVFQCFFNNVCTLNPPGPRWWVEPICFSNQDPCARFLTA